MRQTAVTLAGLGLVVVGALAGHWFDEAGSPAPPERFETVQSAYEVIRDSYVDPVPAESLTAAGIRGMTESLDPFSVYIAPDRMKRVEESFSGSFEGIGVSYELIDGPNDRDTIGVTTVVADGPSAEAGLRAGDRIVEVEGESAVGWSHQKIQRRLKGPEGSTVRVTLRRPSEPSPIERTIRRGTVPMETVDAAYMMDDRTGYLRLNRFARTTHREVTDALTSLKEQGMTRLMLDLRGNAGGLMSMAEAVADEFLVEGQLIVEARSRHEQYGGARYATEEGLLESVPLVVLVDEHSASASEIVAGALQDHDRAVLVGRRTFGKGLVQRQFDLQDGSGLRLTVARFYTPSGRLLQRSDERAEGALSVPVDTSALPDSLLHRTDAGRLVVGGGSIHPDRVVVDSIENPYRRAVTQEGIVRDFARRWADAHSERLRAEWAGRPDAFARDFELPSVAYSDFVEYAAGHGRSGEGGKTAGFLAPSRTDAVVSGGPFDPEAIRAARPQIETDVTAYLGRRLFGPSMFVRIRNRSDDVLQAAHEAWPRAEKWADRYPVSTP